MSGSRWMRNAACCVALAAFVSACGAGDRDSNAVDPQPALCPTAEEIAPNFFRLLRSDRFSGLREVLEENLGTPLDPADPNGPTHLNALLGVFIDAVSAVEVSGLRDVLFDALRSTEAGPLLPQALGLLKYIDGQLGCPTGTTCDHYDFLDVLRKLLFSNSCNQAPVGFTPRTILDLLVRLLKYPRLTELIDLMPRLLQNPTLQGVLDNFSFDQCDNPPCEQEDGFAALLDILLDNVLVSPLPWDDIRDLLGQVGFDTPEVLSLIGLAEDLLVENPSDPERDVLTPMRAAIRCLRQVDPGRRLVRNLYRVLTLDEVSLDGLLEGVDRLLDADPERLTLKLFEEVFEHFRGEGFDSFRTLQLVLDVLLTPTNMRGVVPALILMIEEGVVPELVDLLTAIVGDCSSL